VVSPTLQAHLLTQLDRDEGYRRHPYRDTAGILTVGFGRNLEAVGISRGEALLLLANDLEAAAAAVGERWPWAAGLDEPRLGVLINMAVNLGPWGLAEFRRMLAACRAGEYDTAAAEMLDSRWAGQVGDRAQRLAQQMRSGQWA
jgi:lysozyme